MATYVGGLHGEVSSSFYRRPSTTTTTTSKRHQYRPIWVSYDYAYIFQGLRRIRRCSSLDIHNDQQYARGYRFIREKLEASKASPYLIFRLVTTDDLLNIERARENGKIDRGVRMTHYVDWDILILKVPTAEHEVAHRNFSKELTAEAMGMGLRW